MRRHGDGFHESVAKVVREFGRTHGIGQADLDLATHIHKRLRGELLVLLKEKAGLSYREIAKLDIFGDLSLKTENNSTTITFS